MGLSDLKPTNMSAFVRGKLTEIEAAIVSGVSHYDVWNALREQGLTLTFHSYMSAVKRARKARGVQPGQVPVPASEASKSTHSAAHKTWPGESMDSPTDPVRSSEYAEQQVSRASSSNRGSRTTARDG